MKRQFLFFFSVLLLQGYHSNINSFSSSLLRTQGDDQSSNEEQIARGVSFANCFLKHDDRQQDLSFARSKNAIIAFHGLGDWAHDDYKKPFSKLSNVVTFVPDMPYSTKYLNEKTGIVSMGGTADLAAAFTILNGICDAGYEKIALYGFSCGGGIILNMLYALQEPKQFKNLFEVLDINPSLLKSKIKGCIIDRPFSGYEYTVKAVVGKFIGALVGLGGYRETVSGILKNSYTGNEVTLDGIEPFYASEYIKNMPLFFHGATKDKVVGFEGVRKIQKTLRKDNPVHFAQSKGGHVDQICECLKNSWAAFLQDVLK